MSELSKDARRLLDLYAAKMQAPADLGTADFDPSEGLRSTSIRPRFGLRALAISVGLAAAAVAVIWIGGLSMRSGTTETGGPKSQAPYQAPEAEPMPTRSRAAPEAPEPEHSPAAVDVELPPPTAIESVNEDPERTVRPKQSDEPKAPTSTLAAEIELLDAARRSLDDGDLSGAKRTLAEYRRKFPEGKMAPERDLLEERMRTESKGELQ